MTATATRNGTGSGTDVAKLLGPEADSLLNHKARIPKETAAPARPRFRRPGRRGQRPHARVLRNFQLHVQPGRLAGTGYMSILPVDQGIEHSAGASFARTRSYFDPENIVKLAIEGGCNAVASHARRPRARSRASTPTRSRSWSSSTTTSCSTYPNQADQILFGSVKQAFDMGAVAVGATIYFGSRGVRPADPGGRRRPSPRPTSWAWSRSSGATSATTPSRQGPTKRDYHVAADLTGQANHLGVTIQADIIKQKLPDEQRRLQGPEHGRRSYGKLDERMYTELAGRTSGQGRTRSTCAATRSPTATWAAAGLINSGGERKGASDLAEAVRTAVINKRAGGMGLISGRKAFQRPMTEGVKLLNAIQDVYLDEQHHRGVAAGRGAQGRTSNITSAERPRSARRRVLPRSERRRPRSFPRTAFLALANRCFGRGRPAPRP